MIQTQTETGAHAAWAPLAAGAASGALFASSLWVPPLGFLLSLASPLPLALETWRRGTFGAATATAAGVGAAGLLSGPIGGAVYLSQFAAGGCLLGWAARRRMSPAAVIGGYTVVTVSAFWIFALWLAGQAGTEVSTFVDRTLAQSLEQATARLIQGDPDAQLALAVQAWAEQTRGILRDTFPALFTILTLATAWGNALCLRRITRASADDPWLRWRAPEGWIWILIGSGLLAALAPAPWSTAALNVFLVAVAVYLLLGIAIVQFLFVHKGFPRVLRAAAYLLLLLQLPAMLFVAGLGAFDLWLDFRARLERADDDGAREP